ncbi:MAG: hypothetical protein ACJ70S_04540, partial [Nitrososphaera sp.]
TTSTIAERSPSYSSDESSHQEQQQQRQQQQQHYETLHEWIMRLVKGQGSGSIKNLDDMKAALATVVQLPSPQQDPDVYRDYGSDLSFTAKTARGECAA